LVPIVRFALEHQPVIEPFSDSVAARFDSWLMQKQSGTGVSPVDSGNPVGALLADARSAFTPDQLTWLRPVRDHIATSLSIEPVDLDLSPFNQRGGRGKAHQLLGEHLPKLLDELNEVLAA
jgi:type I restriction enzyme R subunit